MKKMNFEEFSKEIVEKIKEYLPESFEQARVELQTVMKTNDVKLTGIMISSADSNVTPTIYLESFYKSYCDGTFDMENALSEIARIRLEHEFKGCLEVNEITDFEIAKDKIVPRLVNRKWNSELLELRPYTELADLAVTYHVMLSDDAVGGVSSCAVTHQLMERWGVDVETLHKIAVSNMKKLLPSRFRSMTEVLMGMIPDAAGLMPEDERMFVLSNSKGMGGAAAILDDEMMKYIIERLGEDIIIIPSSVHEVLIIKQDNMDVEEIDQMIREVNAMTVAPDEQLGDHAYSYMIGQGLIA